MERMQGKDSQEKRLDGLLAAYRNACPEVDASPEFMPKLWQKIESRRVENFWIFKRLAQACVATAAIAIALSLALTPAPQENEALSSSYTEILAADNADQAYVQALPADLPGDLR